MELLLSSVILFCFLTSVNVASSGGFAENKNVYTVEALRDKVTDPLPGFASNGNVPFDHYAGYVTVNETAGRALFYWLTEAAEDPSSKPLILWLSGGPGCSSVGYGAMEEIGPFHLNMSNVVLNAYSWNKAANILFLESPAGVGFSYSNTSSDYQTGDAKTARDSLIFLQRWLERYPVYRSRDFYLTGESYAGNYIPQLAKLIHESNKDAPSGSAINLKGFMVGNAVMDQEQDFLGTIDYWYSHALISHQTYQSLIHTCILGEGSEDECDAVQDSANDEIGHIYPYNIYAEACLSYKTRRTANLRMMKLRTTKFPGYDPCIEDRVYVYLNRPEVQIALHANLSVPWRGCSENIGTNWQDRASSALSIYKELIQAAKFRIWVYSGDMDSVVPVTSSRYSIQKLNLTIVTPWFPWYRNGQVGGYSEAYEGLTFVTIRGAGHEVPVYQPGQALTLIQSFLAGKEMPRQQFKFLE